MPQWGLSFSEAVLWNITCSGDRGMTFILPAFVTSITPPPTRGAFAPALRYVFVACILGGHADRLPVKRATRGIQNHATQALPVTHTPRLSCCEFTAKGKK